jgi:hypothetical protein
MISYLILLLSLILLLTESCYSQQEELETGILMTSWNDVIRYDCLNNNEIFTHDQGEDDFYSPDTIVFRNMGTYGLKITTFNYVTELEELIFYQKRFRNISYSNYPDEDVIVFSLWEHGLKCCEDITFEIIDTETETIVKKFILMIHGDGDGN